MFTSSKPLALGDQLPSITALNQDGKAFGVPMIPIVGISLRQSFLINQGGKLIWSSLKAKTKEAAAEVQQALRIKSA